MRKIASEIRRGVNNHMVIFAALLSAGLASGCATPYAYTFHLTDPGVQSASGGDRLENDDVDAQLWVDARGAQAVVLSLRNKTGQPLQVRWSDVVLIAPGGASSAPRPDADLGWIEPDGTQTARLIPFVLPDRGDAAAAYEGKTFELQVPMLVRRTLVIARYHLAAHVEKAR